MLKKVLKLIVNIFVFVVFGILILVIIGKVTMLVNKSNYFKMFGYSFFNVSTGSMAPFINENDLIIIKDNNNYQVGDVITYKENDSFVTHRIISIDDDNIITKGDANNAVDKVISKSSVIGMLIKVIPKAGIWQKVFTTPSIIIVIFITLILFDFAFSYKGFQQKKIKKKIDKVNNIDLSEISKNSNDIKLTKKEINVLYEKIEAIKNDQDVKLAKKENDFLDYTIGLDLNEIRKKIDENIKKEEQ